MRSTITEDEILDLEPDFPWCAQIPGLSTISPSGLERAVLHDPLVVPESARLSIDRHAASIDLTGVRGPTDSEPHSGPVRGTNFSGALELDTYSGTVQLSYTQLTAPVHIESVQGSVRRTLPKDADFDLEADLQPADQLTSSPRHAVAPCRKRRRKPCQRRRTARVD